jgi:aminoglycoside 2'-N-acetyltransferase I
MELVIREVESSDLIEKILAITNLLEEAYEGDFSEQDWLHTFGGARFVGTVDSEIVAHAAVVPREAMVNDSLTTIGYLEGVAVSSNYQGQGLGGQLLRYVTEFCSRNYEISMLSTDEFEFYGKFGWKRFKGASGVIDRGVVTLTPDEDDGLMYLAGEGKSTLEISTVYCDWREGDYW